MCTVKRGAGGGGTFPKGKITAFVFLSLIHCCYLDNILQVPPGRPSEDEHCGRRVFKGVLSRQHVVPCDWLGHFNPFLPSAFQIWHEPKGLPRLPDGKQSGQKCGSLNAA